MASYTTNYGLHQWESTDDFLRTDFNTDFQKIDTAIEGARTLAEGRADVVTGTYEGSGSTTRTITLGFQPKAVLLFCAGGMTGYSSGAYIIYGGLALPGHPVVDYGHNNEVAVEIVSTGFRLHRDSYRNVNNENVTYYYLALR